MIRVADIARLPADRQPHDGVGGAACGRDRPTVEPAAALDSACSVPSPDVSGSGALGRLPRHGLPPRREPSRSAPTDAPNQDLPGWLSKAKEAPVGGVRRGRTADVHLGSANLAETSARSSATSPVLSRHRSAGPSGTGWEAWPRILDEEAAADWARPTALGAAARMANSWRGAKDVELTAQRYAQEVARPPRGPASCRLKSAEEPPQRQARRADRILGRPADVMHEEPWARAQARAVQRGLMEHRAEGRPGASGVPAGATAGANRPRQAGRRHPLAAWSLGAHPDHPESGQGAVRSARLHAAAQAGSVSPGAPG